MSPFNKCKECLCRQKQATAGDEVVIVVVRGEEPVWRSHPQAWGRVRAHTHTHTRCATQQSINFQFVGPGSESEGRGGREELEKLEVCRSSQCDVAGLTSDWSVGRR